MNLAKTGMIKKTACILLLILAVIPLGGCWNYRGINEITIISGIAIDKDEKTGFYHLTYEIVDLTRDIKETGVRPKIVEAEGKTLFDAARNAKKRLVNRLYFGNSQIIVINQKIAEEEGVSPIIDWFLRDEECRETITVSLSQEKTAEEILTVKGIDQMLVAYELKNIIDKDRAATGSTINAELYTVFNALQGEGVSLMIPAFHKVMNHEELTAEVNGVGIFKGDKLVGFLTPAQVNRVLFVNDEIRAGVLTLSLTGEKSDDVSLEIYKNRTKVKCSYEDGRAKAHISTKTQVSLDELAVKMGLLDEEKIKKIQEIAERKLEADIKKVIAEVQNEYGSDIFGFGNRIYKNDPRLWQEIHSQWDELFQDMDIEVECEILIVNTASLIKN